MKQRERSEYLVQQLPIISRVVSVFILENCCGHSIIERCLCPLLEGQMIGFSSAIALGPVTSLSGKGGCFGIPSGKCSDCLFLEVMKS